MADFLDTLAKDPYYADAVNQIRALQSAGQSNIPITPPQPQSNSLVEGLKSVGRAVTKAAALPINAAIGASLPVGRFFGYSPEQSVVAQNLQGVTQNIEDLNTKGMLAQNEQWAQQHPIQRTLQNIGEGAAPFLATQAAIAGASALSGPAAPATFTALEAAALPTIAGAAKYGETTGSLMKKGISGNEAMSRAVPGALTEGALFGLMGPALGALKGTIAPAAEGIAGSVIKKGILPGFLGNPAETGLVKGALKGLAVDAPWLAAQGELTQAADVAGGAMTSEEWKQQHTPAALLQNLATTALTGAGFGGIGGYRAGKALKEHITTPIRDNVTPIDLHENKLADIKSSAFAKQQELDLQVTPTKAPTQLTDLLPQEGEVFSYKDALKRKQEISKITEGAIEPKLIDLGLDATTGKRVARLETGAQMPTVESGDIQPFLPYQEILGKATPKEEDVNLLQNEVIGKPQPEEQQILPISESTLETPKESVLEPQLSPEEEMLHDFATNPKTKYTAKDIVEVYPQYTEEQINALRAKNVTSTEVSKETKGEVTPKKELTPEAQKETQAIETSGGKKYPITDIQKKAKEYAKATMGYEDTYYARDLHAALAEHGVLTPEMMKEIWNANKDYYEQDPARARSKDETRNQVDYRNKSEETLIHALQKGAIDAHPSENAFVLPQGKTFEDHSAWYKKEILGQKKNKTQNVVSSHEAPSKEEPEISITKADRLRMQKAEAVQKQETLNRQLPHTIFSERMKNLKRTITELNGDIATLFKEGKITAKERLDLIKSVNKSDKKLKEVGLSSTKEAFKSKYNEIKNALQKEGISAEETTKLKQQLTDLKTESRNKGRLELEDKLEDIRSFVDKSLDKDILRKGEEVERTVKETTQKQQEVQKQQEIDKSFIRKLIDRETGILSPKNKDSLKEKREAIKELLNDHDFISDPVLKQVKDTLKGPLTNEKIIKLHTALSEHLRSFESGTFGGGLRPEQARKITKRETIERVPEQLVSEDVLQAREKAQAKLDAIKAKQEAQVNKQAQKKGLETIAEAKARYESEQATAKAVEEARAKAEQVAREERIAKAKEAQANLSEIGVGQSLEKDYAKVFDNRAPLNPDGKEVSANIEDFGKQIIYPKQGADTAEVHENFQKYLDKKWPDRNLIANTEKQGEYTKYWATEQTSSDPVLFSHGEVSSESKVKAEDIKKALREHPNYGQIKVYQSFKDAPETIQNKFGSMIADKSNVKVRGWFDPTTGIISIIADMMSSVKDAITNTLAHEMTHRGLQILGKRGEQLLKQIYLAHKSEIDSMWSIEKDNLKRTNEFIAKYGPTELNKTTWQKIKDYIKEVYNKYLGTPATDQDIKDLFKEIRQANKKTYNIKTREWERSQALGDVVQNLKQFKDDYDPAKNDGLANAMLKALDEKLSDKGLVKQTYKNLFMNPFWNPKLRDNTVVYGERQEQRKVGMAKLMGMVNEKDTPFSDVVDHLTKSISPEIKQDVFSLLLEGDKDQLRYKSIEDLPEKFKGVSKEAFNAYDKVRDFVTQTRVNSLDSFADTQAYTITGGRKGNEDLREVVKNIIKDKDLNSLDKIQEHLIKTNNKEFLLSSDKEIDSLSKDILAQKKIFNNYQSSYIEGYIPRDRLIGGTHKVEVFKTLPDESLQKVYSKFFYNKREADLHLKELQANPENFISLDRVREGENLHLSEAKVTPITGQDYISQTDYAATFNALQASLDKLVNRDDLSPKMKEKLTEEIKQELSKKLLAQQGKANSINRTDHLIEGYDDNPIESINRMINRQANAFAKIKYIHDQLDILNNAPKENQAEISQYIRQTLEPRDEFGRVAQKLKNNAAFMFMGFRPLSALLQMSQMATVGAAELGMYTRRAGIKTPAHVLLGKAAKDIIFNRLSAEEEAMLNKARSLGETWENSSQMNLYRNFNDESVHEMINSRLQSFMGVGMKMFQKAETLNREMAILSSYRVLREGKEGVFDKAAFEKALQFNNSTNHMLNQGNVPSFYVSGKGLKGAAGNLLYTLMGYPLNHFNYMTARLHGGYIDQQFSKGEQRRALARCLGFAMVLGGMSGLPLVNDVNNVIKRLFGKDLKYDARLFLKQNMGKDLSDAITYGMFAPAGVNISHNLAVETPFLSAILADKDPGLSAFGAAGALTKKAIDLPTNLLKGNYQEAFEAAAPEAFAGMSRAYRMYQYGQRTASGQPVYYQGSPVKLTGSEALMQGLFGVKSAKRGEIMESADTERDLQDWWSERKKLAEKHFLTGDTSAIADFNQKLLKDPVARKLVKPISTVNIARPDVQKTAFEEA